VQERSIRCDHVFRFKKPPIIPLTALFAPQLTTPGPLPPMNDRHREYSSRNSRKYGRTCCSVSLRTSTISDLNSGEIAPPCSRYAAFIRSRTDTLRSHRYSSSRYRDISSSLSIDIFSSYLHNTSNAFSIFVKLAVRSHGSQREIPVPFSSARYVKMCC